MIDPFDVLRDELVAAERRVRASDTLVAERRTLRARRRVPWLRRRPLLLAAALVVASGSAAAAVVSLTSEDSAPLAGTVPPPSPTAVPRTYRIELMPDLRAGSIGWCSSVTLRSRGWRPIGASSGCGPAAPAGAAQIAGGVTTVNTKNVLLFAVVDARVAAIRLHNGRTIAARGDRTLPYGWKAAVAFLATDQGRIDPGDLDWTLQDANGAEISRAPNDRAGTKQAGTASLPARTVDARRPPHVRYAIRARGLPGLRAAAAQIAAGAPAHTPDVNGRAFLTRATTVYYLHGRRYRAAVLVDARDGRRAAADLPGATPRAEGLFDASGHLTARRAGAGWLVVEGSDADERALILHALSTST